VPQAMILLPTGLSHFYWFYIDFEPLLAEIGSQSQVFAVAQPIFSV
jgi:hypothetical protein